MGKKQKLCIAQLAPYYFPSIGGVEVVVQYLSEELVRRGHRVSVLTARRTHKGCPSLTLPRQEVINGVHIWRFQTYGTLGHHGFFPGIIRPLLRGDYDIFHSHCYRHPHGEIVSLLGRTRNIPCILHVHGGFSQQRRVKDALYGVYDYLAKKHLINRFSHYIALTDSSKKGLDDRGVVNQQVTVIPNAVAEECFGEVTTGDFRDRYGLVGKKVMLFLGSLHPLKRPELLVPVLAKIRGEVPEAFLLYVGPDAGEYAKVDTLARDLQVEGHVKWIGPLQGREKQQALEAAEFLILPSDEEPFGIVLLEAMARGKPVIATATEGARAVIENTVTGFIAGCSSVDDMVEAALSLLRSHDLCVTMGRKGREAVSGGYRISLVVDQIENLYYELLCHRNEKGKCLQ